MARRPQTLDDLTTPELLREGAAAARVGEDEDARRYLEEATRREPDSAEAWLELAGVAASPAEKAAAFRRVLDLRPGDEAAEAGLQRLARKFGAGVLEQEAAEPETLHCTWHPDQETRLRCARCGRPMCLDCARRHPVGLRCKECTKETRSPLYQVSGPRYVAALVVGIVAGTAAAFGLALLFTLTGGWFQLIIAFLAGGGVGAAVAEAVSWASGRKRGKGLQAVVVVSMIAGVVLVILLGRMAIPRSPSYLLGLLVYLAVGVGGARSRLG